MMATPPTSTTQQRPSKLLSWLEVGGQQARQALNDA